jgi:hypothetical protein
MNRLKNTRAYLCGAIDRVADEGGPWRQQIQDDLNGLGILWLNPLSKPIDIGVEDAETRKQRRANKAAGRYDLVEEEMRSIRSVDLELVAISNFLIVNIDVDCHSCGTYEELFLANSLNKPILIHVEGGRQNCPDWLFGALPYELIFDTWLDLREYVRHVANDRVVDSMGRWFFWNWTGE